MSMTLEQAKALRYGMVIHSEVSTYKNSYCQRWRVTGKVKIWKRHPEWMKVPLKHGLYGYANLTERDLDGVHLESECPKMTKFEIKKETVYCERLERD